MAFGIHQTEDRDWTFQQNVTVNGNFTFGDASTDNLNIDGNMDVAGTSNFGATATYETAANIVGGSTGTAGLLLKNLRTSSTGLGGWLFLRWPGWESCYCSSRTLRLSCDRTGL